MSDIVEWKVYDDEYILAMNCVGLFRKLLLGSRSQCAYLKQGMISVSPQKRCPSLVHVFSTEPVRFYSQLTHLSHLIKGITMKILQFANSFRVMKNKMMIRRINQDIDPNFRLDNFATDVKYVSNILNGL